MTHAQASLLSRHVAIAALVVQLLTTVSPVAAGPPTLLRAAAPIVEAPVQPVAGSGLQRRPDSPDPSPGSLNLEPYQPSDFDLIVAMPVGKDEIEVQTTQEAMGTQEQTQ